MCVLEASAMQVNFDAESDVGVEVSAEGCVKLVGAMQIKRTPRTRGVDLIAARASVKPQWIS